MLFGDFFKDAIFVNAEIHRAIVCFDVRNFTARCNWQLHGFVGSSVLAGSGGCGCAYYMYLINPAAARRQSKKPHHADLHTAGQQVLHGLV
jgi:NADH-quinone oxidoreductase subunit L